jgi:hypothetical protein
VVTALRKSEGAGDRKEGASFSGKEVK